MGQNKPPSSRSSIKNARQRALEKAEMLGYRFNRDHWQEVAGGARLRCKNKGCQGSLFLRYGADDFLDADKNPTVHKHRCPYIVRYLKIGGRQMPPRGKPTY